MHVDASTSWLVTRLATCVMGVACACNGRQTTPPDASNDAQSADDAAVVVLNPGEIFGKALRLWFDADDVASVTTDGGAVMRWRSRAPTLGREVVAAYPFIADNRITVDPVAPNGRSAIHVGGQRGMFESPRSEGFSFSANSAMIVAIVAAYTNPPAQSGVMFMLPPPNVYVRGNAMGRSIVMGGVGASGGAPGDVWSASEGWNDGKFHTFGFRVGAIDVGDGNAAIRVDGAQWGNTRVIGSDGASMLMIGGLSCVWCDAGATPIEEPLEGYIAEVIMAVNTSGTPTELAQLNAYFQKKYGIPF